MNWFTKIKTMCGFGGNAKTDLVLNTTENTTENTSENTPDYSSMKVAELKGLAKEKGIKGYYKLKKAELIEALNG